jgi:hypothetical protein
MKSIILILMLSISTASAQTNNPPQVISSGGGNSSNSNYVSHVTIGLPFAAPASGGQYDAKGGLYMPSLGSGPIDTAKAVFVVSSDALDFGVVVPSQQATRVVTIRNDAQEPAQLLTVQFQPLQSPFSVLTSPIMLKAGEFKEVAVEFSPVTKGNFSSTLLLSSNVGNRTVALTGVADVADVVGRNELQGVRLYPNPVSNRFYLGMDGARKSNIQVSIEDMLGRTVKHLLSASVLTSDRLEFNLTIEPGTYYLRVQVDEIVSYHKLIKL